MRHGWQSVVVRVAIGLGFAATASFLGPDSGSGPSQTPSREAPPPAAPAPATAPDPGSQPGPATAPDRGCQTVDENGVPLYDSQYEQRTGHAPC